MTVDAWASFRPENAKPLDQIRPSDITRQLGSRRDRPDRDQDRSSSVPSRGYQDRNWVYDSRNNRLEQFQWQSETLTSIVKDFSTVHPIVEARSEQECVDIRLAHGLDVEALSGSRELPIPKPYVSLEELPFPDWVTVFMRNKGWLKPTPIQIQSWPVALKGYDVVGFAATGSGKTMAYAIPMVMHILAQTHVKPGEGPIGLIIVPTQGLCRQVAEEVTSFLSQGKMGLKCKAVTADEEKAEQGRSLQDRVDVVVATPGRLLSLLESKHTNLKRATYVVLDEADELVGDTGRHQDSFGSQVKIIMSQVRPDRQLLLFSATYSPDIENFASSLTTTTLRAASVQFRVLVGQRTLSACEDIAQEMWSKRHTQTMWPVSATKLETLVKAVTMIQQDLQDGGKKAMVFCNERSEVSTVANALKDAGFSAEGYSSNSSETKSSNLLHDLIKRFKEEADPKIVVCTDVLSRGYDFASVKYVFNYSLPHKPEVYVHRIGRTGRAGKKGFSLSLLDDVDLRLAKEYCLILEATKQQIPHWLLDERKRRQKWWAEHERMKRIRDDVGSTAYGDSSWVGRGTSRREEFLGQLSARIAEHMSVL